MSVQPVTGWGVVVDECRINANNGGKDWWAGFWMRYSPTGRITELDQSIAGGLHHVAFDDKDDAEIGRKMMTDNGIHPRCVKVSTLAAARQVVRTRHKTSPRREPDHSCTYCCDAEVSVDG